MKVILLKDVAKLGRKYEVKEVSNGYGSNYLLPNKLAEVASDSKMKQTAVLQDRAAEERKIQAELLEKNFESLEKAKVTVKAKANEHGHLFQGIHKDEIVAALKSEAHIDLDPSMIELGHPIKAVGEFDITVAVGDKKGTFKLSVDPE